MQRLCIPAHGGRCIEHDSKLRHRHCKPQRVRAGDDREEHDENAAYDKAARHRHDERRPRLHYRLKIIGREDVERKQQERQRIGPDDGGRHIQNFRRGCHENADVHVRARHAQPRPEHAEKHRRQQRQVQRFLYALSLARAVVRGDDGLRRLSDAVRAALDKGADLYYRAVYRKCVRAELFHYLPVEQHRQYTHRHVDEEGGKARDRYLAQLCEKPLRAHKPKRIPAPYKVRQHHNKGYP